MGLKQIEDLPAYEFKIISAGEIAAREREDKIERARRARYEGQLRSEYATLKDKQIQLVNRDGTNSCRIDIEELFDMFTLTRNQRDYVTSEF
jgi:DNA invertase Pin-like site-specific DNA recombinase